MNKIGCLIIYDLAGNVISTTGETQTTELVSHTYPVGIPYIELPFGAMKYEEQRLVRIDITDPENPVPVFEPIPKVQTPEERIAELERLLAEKSGS